MPAVTDKVSAMDGTLEPDRACSLSSWITKRFTTERKQTMRATKLGSAIGGPLAAALAGILRARADMLLVE
eukprot:2396386-Amphidinium_carterae.3